MKVLQVLPELNAGGVERGTIEVADFLVKSGHEAVVVSNGGRLVPALERCGARHIAMAVHKKSLLSLFKVRPFRQVLEKELPDILHVRSRLPGWIAWLALRRMDPQKRPHLVTTVHGFYSVNRYSAVMTRGERVIAVSESIRDYILKNFPEIRQERIRVIPRGIDPAEYPRGFSPSAEWLVKWGAEYPQLTGCAVLTLPGRVTRLKGHEDFIRLTAKMAAATQTIRGLIVGDAHPTKKSYLAELKALTAHLGVEKHVTFTGHRSDLREILSVSNIVFSLSTQPESFGRTTLEALALGRSVVAYNHGGVGEQLRRLFPSGLVPLRDETALLETTRRVLEGDAVPTPMIEPYTLSAMCEATIRTYRELST